MSTEHVVVPVAECDSIASMGGVCIGDDGSCDGCCHGCLGDGRRALLDQAVLVERGRSTYAKRMSDGHMSLIMRDGEAWWPLEVES